MISLHRLQEYHDFDWNDVRILDESSWFKRIISEMIHIKIQFCELKKQSDTEMSSDSYTLIIRGLSEKFPT